MKKIVILNGGPRLNGNTQALIQSFTKGAKETGNEVIQFNLQTMHERWKRSFFSLCAKR